ncbi:MAG: FAD-binding protein [Burkholderiales bacterium]|nr:FAD-binding protein [Burkholderiales bacterium]
MATRRPRADTGRDARTARHDAVPIPSRYAELAQRLARAVDGDIAFDAAARGRYATDASIYQIEPIGVVVPRTEEAARSAVEIAYQCGVPVLPRGAGTSQCGQTVGAALVIDDSKYLNEVLRFDAEQRVAVVQPGMVLDQLNAFLRPHGLWFPVDVSTSAQATIGGMAGNNSCGSRSIAYGNMVHNVLAIDAMLGTGERYCFGPIAEDPTASAWPSGYRDLARFLRALYEREKDEIAARFPSVLRRVAGYNLDHLGPPHANAAHLLVGSEGTLAYFERLHLKLSPLPRNRVLGVCHFPRFYTAMDWTQHIVELGPVAVELVDRTMIGLARENAAFRAVVERSIRGDPDAILLVEFAGEDQAEQVRRLQRLGELMADLGLPGSVVPITEERAQKELWEVRKAGLNIMMSMKGDGKPVSFIEDCAVPLEHLAEYTERLTQVFAKHGTRGTWYAHASVGTLHVRPILDMRRDGAAKMRSIAEEACALVKQYKGAYSGEHGDGLVRSEWIAPFFGPRLTSVLGEIKQRFDPRALMNPGKIVDPPRQDDRSLFRFKPGYRTVALKAALDWSPWGGYDKAVEMCNNNGHCRKFDAGTMCPSYRVTRDEQHLTRGRANTLRLALSGQLGAAGIASQEVREALDLCVSCKGCKRECPTGVDMARMKLEATYQWRLQHAPSMRERLIGALPRYAPWAARVAPLLNLRDRIPGLAAASERLLGFSARRKLPQWRRDRYRDQELTRQPVLAEILGAGREQPGAGAAHREVVLLVDTFNRYFEPENVRCAIGVLQHAGYRVHLARALDAAGPLCCGRTYLAQGMLEAARAQLRRLLAALAPYVERGIPVIGLEPSCLLSLRDELLALVPARESGVFSLDAYLFEEFLDAQAQSGRIELALKPLPQRHALLHGHCHQKAFDVMASVERVLRLVPELEIEPVTSSCCGMAGAFGYEAEHYDISMRMAEASLLPRVRAAGPDTLLVADGTSCRQQIRDGAGREAVHVARVLHAALQHTGN